MPKLFRSKKKVDQSKDPLQDLILEERIRFLKSASPRESNADDSKVYRSDQRRKEHRVATIVLGGGASLSCLVRDISDTGARLTLVEEAELPDMFQLRVPTLQIDRRVGLVWRRDYEVGVAFL